MNFVRDGMPRRKRGRPKSTGLAALPAKKFKTQPAPVSDDDPVLPATPIAFDLDISNLAAERERAEVKRLENLDPHYARAKRFIYSDFQSICNTSYVNNNLKQYLEQYDEDAKMKKLEWILDKCYNLTNGDVKTCKLMMKTIEINTSICLTRFPLPDKKKEPVTGKKRRRLKNIKIRELMEKSLDMKIKKLFGEEYFQSDKDEMLNKKVTSPFDSSNQPNTSNLILNSDTEISEDGCISDDSKNILPVIQKTVEKRYSRVISYVPNKCNGQIKIENELPITKQMGILMDKSNNTEQHSNKQERYISKMKDNSSNDNCIVKSLDDPISEVINVMEIKDNQQSNILNSIQDSIKSDKTKLKIDSEDNKTINIICQPLFNNNLSTQVGENSEDLEPNMGNVNRINDYQLHDVLNADSKTMNYDKITLETGCDGGEIIHVSIPIESIEKNMYLVHHLDLYKQKVDSEKSAVKMSNIIEMESQKLCNISTQLTNDSDSEKSQLQTDSIEQIKNNNLCNDIVNKTTIVESTENNINNSVKSILEIGSDTEKIKNTSYNEILIVQFSKNDVQIIPEKVYNQVVGSLENPPSEMDNLGQIENHKLCNDEVNKTTIVELTGNNVNNTEIPVIVESTQGDTNSPENSLLEVGNDLNSKKSQLEMDNIDQIKNSNLCNDIVNQISIVDLTENNVDNSENLVIVESTQGDTNSPENSLLEVGNDLNSEKSQLEIDNMDQIKNYNLCNDIVNQISIVDLTENNVDNSENPVIVESTQGDTNSPENSLLEVGNDLNSEKSQLEIDNMDQIKNSNLCNDIVNQISIVELTENNVDNSENPGIVESTQGDTNSPEDSLLEVGNDLNSEKSQLEIDNIDQIKNSNLCNDKVNQISIVESTENNVDNSENPVIVNQISMVELSENNVDNFENPVIVKSTQGDTNSPENSLLEVGNDLNSEKSQLEIDNMDQIKNYNLCNDIVNQISIVDLTENNVDNSENPVIVESTQGDTNSPENSLLEVGNDLNSEKSQLKMEYIDQIKNSNLCNDIVNQISIVELTENNVNNSENHVIIESTQGDTNSHENYLLEVGNDLKKYKNTSEKEVSIVQLPKNNEVTECSEKSTSEMNIVIDIENQQLCNDLANKEIIMDSIQYDINNSGTTASNINPKNFKLWMQILMKTKNMIDPNSNVFKNSVVTDLATYFSKTKFLFKPDLFWMSTERVFIRRLLINLIEMFNNTENNMAYLSGCLICVFREIAKKSSIPPHEMESKFNIFIYIIVRYIKCYNDKQFWNKWMISSTTFISWCFVLACIFIPEMQQIKMDFNENKLYKEAIKYLDIVAYNQYKFENKMEKPKPKSGIFELTISDDIASLNSINTDNSINESESNKEPILSNHCIETTNQTQSHHVVKKTQGKIIIENKNEANNTINAESNEEPEDLILSNHCIDLTNQTEDHHVEEKTQGKIVIKSKNEANNTINAESNKETEDLILSNHCIETTNQTQNHHVEKKIQGKIVIENKNEANNTINAESNKETEDLILSNHCIETTNQTQNHHVEKKIQGKIVIENKNEANNTINAESNKETEDLILSNHCIETTNQTQNHHVEKKIQGKIVIENKNEANNTINAESNEEPENLILSNHFIDLTNQTRDHHVEKETKSKILTKGKNKVLNKEVIQSKKKVQKKSAIHNKKKVQSNKKVENNKEVQNENNFVGKVVICAELQKNTFKNPIYLFNNPIWDKSYLEKNNFDLFKSLNKTPVQNNNIQNDPPVRNFNVEPLNVNPTVTQIFSTQAAPPNEYTIANDPQRYNIPGSSGTKNHLSPYYNNISSHSSSNLQPSVEPSSSTSLCYQSIVNMSNMSMSNNYMNNTYQTSILAVNELLNTTTINKNQSNQSYLPNTQFTCPMENSMLSSTSLNNVPCNQCPAYPEYSNTVNNFQQRSVSALPSASSTVPSSRTHANQSTYNSPMYNMPWQVDRNCLPAITTLGRNFQPPDYNTQVSPGLPDVRQQNMPNQLNSNVIVNINSKNGCMHSNCTNTTVEFSCCPSAQYCSYKCMRSDWHYHKNECSKSYSQ